MNQSSKEVLEAIQAGEYIGVANLTPEQYHSAHKYLSNSGLKAFAESPAHYQLSLTAESRNEKLGTGTHMRVLERPRFDALVEVVPNRLGGNGTKARALEAEGKFVITESEREKIVAMSDAITTDPDCARFVTGGQAEVSLFWKDPETGIMMRARLDYYLASGVIVDLKYFNSVKEREVQKQMHRMKYAHQTAIYLDAVKYALGVDSNLFVHLFVTEPDALGKTPVVARPFALNDASIELARHQIGFQKQRFAECLASGMWPAFKRPENGITVTSLPDYAWDQNHDEE